MMFILQIIKNMYYYSYNLLPILNLKCLLNQFKILNSYGYLWNYLTVECNTSILPFYILCDVILEFLIFRYFK